MTDTVIIFAELNSRKLSLVLGIVIVQSTVLECISLLLCLFWCHRLILICWSESNHRVLHSHLPTYISATTVSIELWRLSKGRTNSLSFTCHWSRPLNLVKKKLILLELTAVSIESTLFNLLQLGCRNIITRVDIHEVRGSWLQLTPLLLLNSIPYWKLLLFFHLKGVLRTCIATFMKPTFTLNLLSQFILLVHFE